MKARPLDPQAFTAHRDILNHPDEAAVRDAFTRLPKRACVELHCPWSRRLAMQKTLVDLGAFAICLRPTADFQEVRITALKGKVGACFETGRSATYGGAALAVMDDDHHLIVGTIRVCEKTGGLYTLPPYRGLLTVTEGDAALIRRLEMDPLPFDCNTFEQDADRLATGAFAPAQTGAPFSVVFYPGPFSLLVLQDGSILRRGICATVPAQFVKDLEQKDGLLPAPPTMAAEAEHPTSYPSAYRTLGAGCLLDEPKLAKANPDAAATVDRSAEPAPEALTALRTSSEETQQRLRRLIDGQEPYFILTGSDPRDAVGCCPSPEVGEANRLVEAGLLACHRTPAPADACSTTLYAFVGEVGVRDDKPEFSINVVARRQAAEVLGKTARGRQVGRAALKTALLLLATASLLIAGRRALPAFGPAPTGFEAALARALNATNDDRRLFVCLFHAQETCDACEAMGRLCRQTVDSDFALQQRTGLLAYRQIAFDAPANRKIRERLGLYSSTVGLVWYDRGRLRDIRMLTQKVWSLWADDAAFISMLRDNIRALLPGNS